MNELAPFVVANPVSVLTDEKQYSEFYAKIKAEVSSHVPDVSTDKGRKEIASLAYKVARTKTAIDAAGKKLNEEARATINAVDASRRKIRDELDALADEVRKPLTDWEDAEEERLNAVKVTLNHIDSITFDPNSSSSVQASLDHLNSLALEPDVFRDELPLAEKSRATMRDRLSTALITAKQYEADQVELARLRQEQIDRDRAEHERLQKEAAEKAAADAKAQAEEDAKRREAEQKAREERAAETARAEEKRRADAAIAKAEAEKLALIKQQEAVERERQAALEAERQAQAKRDADRKHRGEVMAAAKTAIMTVGVDEEPAKKIVLAIVAGEIPHVTLRF